MSAIWGSASSSVLHTSRLSHTASPGLAPLRLQGVQGWFLVFGQDSDLESSVVEWMKIECSSPATVLVLVAKRSPFTATTHIEWLGCKCLNGTPLTMSQICGEGIGFQDLYNNNGPGVQVLGSNQCKQPGGRREHSNTHALQEPSLESKVRAIFFSMWWSLAKSHCREQPGILSVLYSP